MLLLPVFIRDCAQKGTDSIDGGPCGRHFTCDLVTPGHIYSFRFTVDETDYMYVLDFNYPMNANGKITVLKPGKTPYNPATGIARRVTQTLAVCTEANAAIGCHPG